MSLSRIEAWKRWNDPDGFTKLSAGMTEKQIRSEAEKNMKRIRRANQRRKK